MILQGNKRGGAKQLALHLVKDENDFVEIHELRGFVSDALMGALNEAYALSRGTKAKQFLFSLSLNPPIGEKATTKDFEDAIERVEKKLGLSGQPRAIVFHEKQGRRHAHAVWSRIDAENSKAIELAFTKRKLKDISRDLYLQHGWEMPEGFKDKNARNPLNFTLAQWQQAKRVGKDPKAIKATLQTCWANSDSCKSFCIALQKSGYTVAKGDKRGFVVVDYRGEVYSLSKWLGVKAKAIRAKLGEPLTLPSVNEAKAQIADRLSNHLSTLKAKQHAVIDARLQSLNDRHTVLLALHKAARAKLDDDIANRQAEETRQRQQRFTRGLRGVFDFLIGKHKKIKQQNELEAEDCAERDKTERDELVFTQVQERYVLTRRIERLSSFYQQRTQLLDNDIHRYNAMRQSILETFNQQTPATNAKTYIGPSFDM